MGSRLESTQMIATLWDRPAQLQNKVLEDEDRFIVGARDARVRVLSAVFLIAAVLGATKWQWIFGAAVVLSLFGKLTGITFREQQHRLIHVEGFMLALFLLLPLTVPGHPLLELGPLTFSAEGTWRAFTIALKVFATVLVVFVLLGSLEPVRLARALAALGVPVKLVHLMLFSIRYIAVFRREIARLTDAMRARAFAPSSNVHTLATYGNLIGMMVVRSIERAERVDEAMRCRAFSGQFPLRSPRPLKTPDMLFGLCAGSVAIGFVLLSRSV